MCTSGPRGQQSNGTWQMTVCSVCFCVSLLRARNRQLPLLIIIAGPVLSFPFSPPAAVYSCPSFTYATWLMPPSLTFVLHPFGFSAPIPPAAVLPVNIKLPIYFMQCSAWTSLWIAFLCICWCRSAVLILGSNLNSINQKKKKLKKQKMRFNSFVLEFEFIKD